MGGYKEWQRKQAGRPLFLYLGIGGLMLAFGTGYRYYYRPWQARKHLAESEEYAEVLKTLKSQ